MTTPLPTRPNFLRRGADPYADAKETDQRTGLIPFEFNATDWNAGGTKQYYCPVNGRIRELLVVVDVLSTGGASVMTVGHGTETVMSLTIPNNAPTGSRYSKTNEPAANVSADIVEKGDLITLTADGAPSAGAVRGFIRISADEPNLPIANTTSTTSSGTTSSTQT